MKKILAVILATSSIAAFADTFQDFNNNLYATYQYANYHVNGTENGSTPYNGYGIGGTFQSKNDVWANVSMINNVSVGSVFENQVKSTNLNVRAGYAFQFFGDDDSGFQVIPYASMTATNSADYTWGLGIQPEYRLLSSLKVSMGVGVFGYNGNGSGFSTIGQDQEDTTAFAFNVNPEVQYDIAKTIMLSVGYNFATPFNANTSVSANTVTAKVGYLF